MTRVRLKDLSRRLDKIEAKLPPSEQKARVFTKVTCSLMTWDELRFARCVIMHLSPSSFPDWQLCGLVINEEIQSVLSRLAGRLHRRLVALATLSPHDQEKAKRGFDLVRTSRRSVPPWLDQIGEITTDQEDLAVVRAVVDFDRWQGREPGPRDLANEFRVARSYLKDIGAI